MHRVVTGGADRSYGIEVGRLAGLPREVLIRAKDLLGRYEGEKRLKPRNETAGLAGGTDTVQQLGLFAAHHPVMDELASMNPDSMTPLEALTELNRLVTRARQG